MKILRWQKQGFIFNAESYSDWMFSHIQNPCPIELENRIRIFFNTRPKQINRQSTSHPAYIDLDKNDLNKIISVANSPIMNLGDFGCFDEFGCMTSSVFRKNNGELWMYYVGWQRMQSVPYNWAIGLAVSKNEGDSFERMYKGPIIGAYKNEAYLQNGCYVFHDTKNDIFHMFYSSGKNWFMDNDKPESQYQIMHATSNDGINWQREGKFIIPNIYPDETQTTPVVFNKDGKYHMIFSSRHSIDFRNKERGYKLGYANSLDLIHWERNDDRLDLPLSKDGWDSEMICYPQTIEINNKLILFYCGNYFGAGGLGYAILNH